ncbi:MAG: hypothetical protein JO364_12325 [Pseudonocardiales bacterium]|nr:hypothetical protein [Pseudonocardiales bacterium]MBV9031062.1 hypothetical protein [Pseudonocardiales bacterium]
MITYESQLGRSGDGGTLHDLRASHGTWITERFGVMAAAKRLGHANASVTTRHYARASAEFDEGIADGLDNARNPGTPAHRTGSDHPANVARNWHDGDNEGPTEAA